MPIVKYQRQQTISGTNPVALADVSSAGNVATTIGQSVETLAKRYQEIKKQNDEIALLNKSNQYDTFLTDKIIDIQTNKTGEKAFTALDDFKKENTSYQSELSKDVSDPVQKAKLSNIFSTRTNDANLKLANHVSQQRQVALNYGLQNTLDNTTKGVQSGLINVSDGLDIIDTNVHRLATSGVFKSQEEVETKKTDLKGKLLETYFDNLNINNPAAVTEMLKNGTINVRGQAVKFTDFLPAEKLNEIKKTALIAEKSKNLQDEKDKIEKELVYTENLQKTLAESNAKGSVSWAQVRKAATTDTTGWTSHGIKNLNNVVEKYTAINHAKDKENERLIKEGLKDHDTKVGNELTKRAIVEPGDDNIPSENKVTLDDVDMARNQGLISNKEAVKIKGIIKKSYDFANPLSQQMKTKAIKAIDAAEANGIFGKPKSEESAIEKGKTMAALNGWLDKNPDKDPSEYISELFKDKTVNKIKTVLGKIAGGLYDPEDVSLEDIRQREKELSPKNKTKETTKVLNGKTYIKQNGKWYEK